MLILSIFPGVDLLGRGFELEGHCVVRGPDLLWGGDVRTFHPPPGKFDGLIAGSPCQDFSRKRRKRQTPPTGYGLEMLSEFVRVALEAQPDWWLLENVPTVPDVQVPGYVVQRLDLNARECGSAQDRLRHFQFGSRQGLILVPRRAPVTGSVSQKTVLATEGRRKHRRGWVEFCQLQGQDVTAFLAAVLENRSAPVFLRSDNGTEFTSQTVQAWLEQNKVGPAFIPPGQPWKNGFIESFHDKFRDECLQREWFQSLLEAKVVIEAWRLHYNTQRPHSSLAYQTPAAFAANHPAQSLIPVGHKN